MKDYKSQINGNFKSHRVGTDEGADMDLAREHCRNLAHVLNNLCPDGREKSIALTKLEEVMFWANASIARHKK